MFRTEATMKDQIGVVHQLLAGIARLHINVVKEESSAINYLNHHQVDLVLDWRTSFFRDRLLSRPEILSRYAPLKYRVPVADYRYVLLYEAIMSECGDVILFDHEYGEYLPKLSMYPLSTLDAFQSQPVAIERDKSRSFRGGKLSFRGGKLKVPDSLLAQIRVATTHFDEDPIPYILSSETTTRTLRVFFPKSLVST